MRTTIANALEIWEANNLSPSHCFRIILSLFLVALVACTENQSRNNEHQNAPEEAPSSIEAEETTALSRALQDIPTFRGPGHEALRSFFENQLTENFLVNLAQERDPKELRYLSQFHRVFHQYSADHPEDQANLSQLSYDYYQRLISVCSDQFQTCSILGLYTHSVYAGNVFLLAEPLISEGERERYILFTTNIGYPQNNIPVLERRLHWMVTDISDDKNVDLQKIQKLTNLIVYLSIESQSFPQEPLEALFQLTQQNSSNTPLINAFEKILNISLEQNAEGPSLEIARKYVLNILGQSQLEDVLQMQNNQGLIRWKGNLKSFSKTDNWQLYFVLYGFLNPQYSGALHRYFFSKTTENQQGQKQLFNIALSYIYKKFVKNAYLSHERIGAIWQEEFERYGKVEPMFFEFFRKADATLAEIWNVSYKREVERIINEITPYYTSEELEPIKEIENNLDSNIRNIVAYPTQFISGYFASRQGDFDFKFFIMSGFLDASIVHMNDNYFFKEHFDGAAPVMFDFISDSSIDGLEALLSFYISLDERILKSYGLDLSFTQGFLDRYLSKERQYFLNKKEEMNRYFSTGTTVQRMRQQCEKIHSGDLNFTYDLPFKKAENRYYLGQVYNYAISFGTSRELLDFIEVFNNQDLSKNLTETMEQLRMEFGIKINRMNLMQQALIAQGNHELSNEIETHVNNFQTIADQFFVNQKDLFFEMANCLVTFESIEEKMRLEHFKQEIEFARATYIALDILNANVNRELTLSEVRQEYPQAFENSLFKTLPESGDFLPALNSLWLSFGSQYKDEIQGYHNRITPQIGFQKRSNKPYAFYTNAFEQRFRLLDQLTSSEQYGTEYPKSRLSGMPRDYEELDLIFGEGDDHFFRFEKSTNETESQFLYKFFTHNGFRKSGFATQYLFGGQESWKLMYLNMASIAKTKAFNLVRKNYEYGQYQELFETHMASDFQKLADFTERLLKVININEKEKEILHSLQANNFKRDDPLGPGGVTQPANSLFVYNNIVDFYTLGHYDVFFNVLVSHQLGGHADFIPGLFGSGPNHQNGLDQNPLVWHWIPKPVESSGPGGGLEHVNADDAHGRRSLHRYSISNSLVAREYDQTNLFAIHSHAKQTILHDLYHTVMADRGLIDAFVKWTEKRAQNNDITPYQIDLYFHKTPVVPDYILPSIRDRYYDWRHQFDIESLHVFKNLENQGSTEGPQ